MKTSAAEPILPAEAPRTEWLSARRAGIGSSDASAVVGLNPYASPLSVWLDKLGENPRADDDNEAMELGRELEPVVATLFTRRTGKRVRRVGLLRSKKWPWMQASCDRLLTDEPALLEIKTTSAHMAHEWANNEIPDHPMIQITHQLAVTGLERAYVAVLIGGQRFCLRVVERDEAAIEQLVDHTGRFWHDHVLTGAEPPATAPDVPLLAKRYKSDPNKTVLVDSDFVQLLQDRALLRGRIGVLEKQHAGLTARVQQILGEATAATTGDGKPILTYADTARGGYSVEETTYRSLTLTPHGKELISHG